MSTFNDFGLSDYDKSLQQFESALVRGTLIQAGGNICKAAKIAGKHRNTFTRKIQHFKIDVGECKQIAKQQRQTQ